MAEAGATIQGKRIAIVGRLASMNRRELVQLLRRQGAMVVEKPGPKVEIIVLGEAGTSGSQTASSRPESSLPPEIQEAVAQGQVEIVPEAQLWQRLGLMEPDPEIQRRYTLAMLAELLRVPLAVVRQWYRRGLIHPACLVGKLPYFDFSEVAVARRLAELYTAGASPQAIQRQMADLSRSLPGIARPLGQLPVRIEGKQILLWRENRLMETSGQLRFDFDSLPSQEENHFQGSFSWASSPSAAIFPLEANARWGADAPPYYTSEELVQMALELEEAGQLRQAAEMLRAALAAAGPSAELCFQLAELLYRMGDISGARERYYMAIELDENFVEVRNNLGCLLVEIGEWELALAAFQGALAHHPHYADAHYHLARLLDEWGRPQEAEDHWRSFLALAPESPWVQQARSRLGEPPA